MLRASTRGQGSDPFKREDFVVGPELVWLALTIFVAGIADKSTQYVALKKALQSSTTAAQGSAARYLDESKADRMIEFIGLSGYVVFGLFFFAVATGFFVRMFGWERPDYPRTWRGIVIPAIIGLASLGLAMSLLSGSLIS